MRFERARREIVPHGGAEAVDATVAGVLGQVDPSGPRIHDGRLVREFAHRGTRDALAGQERVAFPHETRAVFLAGQPRAPRRGATRAVVLGAVENPIRVVDPAVGEEADRAGTAARAVELGVGDVGPAAPSVRVGEGRAAVGRAVPRVVGAVDPLAGHADEPRLEAVGQAGCRTDRPPAADRRDCLPAPCVQQTPAARPTPSDRRPVKRRRNAGGTRVGNGSFTAPVQTV